MYSQWDIELKRVRALKIGFYEVLMFTNLVGCQMNHTEDCLCTEQLIQCCWLVGLIEVNGQSTNF